MPPPTEYRLKSLKTHFSPVTEQEVPGRIVDTRPAAHFFPPDSVLTFSDPVDNEEIVVSITGPAGCFLALPPDAEEGTRVIWSEKPFSWRVLPSPGDNGQSVYRFVPENGANLFIYDDSDIGPVLVVKPTHMMDYPESYFTLTPA
ncbi:hypothetical protein BJ165DRAFT_1594787 [Panaeolus papilionaceus]|nr:hypothetical protein BJ165DRAFT_1594787 [Panaeolus papilionaceus]